MKKISHKYAQKNNLKLVKSLILDDMSKAILAKERLAENKEIKYYNIEYIYFDQISHKSDIKINFFS